jgi:hypothetical protein
MSKQPLFRYAGTPDPMTREESERCKKYLKRHEAELVKAGRFLVDVSALLTPFHLDCANCRTVHSETCCEGGQPYALESWQTSRLCRELPAITRHFFGERGTSGWTEENIWDQRKLPGTLRLTNGRCVFFREIDGIYGCALHAYAEQTNAELHALKPFSCQLYPLDLIDTGKSILLTALTAETASFSRWGSDYLEQFYCANRKRRREASHLDENRFSLAGYRPAYEWNLPLLRYLLKEESVRVEAILQKTRLTQLESVIQPPK